MVQPLGLEYLHQTGMLPYGKPTHASEPNNTNTMVRQHSTLSGSAEPRAMVQSNTRLASLAALPAGCRRQRQPGSRAPCCQQTAHTHTCMLGCQGWPQGACSAGRARGIVTCVCALPRLVDSCKHQFGVCSSQTACASFSPPKRQLLPCKSNTF